MDGETGSKPRAMEVTESTEPPNLGPGSAGARLLRSDRLEEFLNSFHRLTRIRSRLVIESDGAEVTAHDSLGDVRGVEFTESSWLVMPSLRVRLAAAPASPRP